jgi:hypothetical protein
MRLRKGRQKKSVALYQDNGSMKSDFYWILAAAGWSAGARLHSRENESLGFLKINARGHQHIIRPGFQEYLQPAQFKGNIARLGSFGYVHSQWRASAARDDKYANTVAVRSLFLHNLFEFLYSAIGQAYHASTSSLVLFSTPDSCSLPKRLFALHYTSIFVKSQLFFDIDRDFHHKSRTKTNWKAFLPQRSPGIQRETKSDIFITTFKPVSVPSVVKIFLAFLNNIFILSLPAIR